MPWEPQQKWNWLCDETHGGVTWRKELRHDCLAFVCYIGDNERGLIPLEYNGASDKYREWWRKAYDNHPDGIVLRQLMNEVALG